MTSMESLIAKQRQGRPAEEIVKLNLNNCQSTEIVGLSDEYKNLTSLSLVNVGLTSLKSFPALTKLKKLDLSDNRLANDLSLLHCSSSLSYLNLSGNLIKDIDTLQPLKSLRELKTLDLYNCEVTNTEGYREKVFELLDGLLYLDGFDRDDQEADIDDDSEGEDDHNGDELDEEDEDEEDDGDVGLSYLDRPDLENESDGEEFAPGEEVPDDVDEEEEGDDSEEEPSRGVKRKRTDEEEEAEAK